MTPACYGRAAVKVLLGLLKTMRPHQWVKNLVVLGPLVFAHQLLNLDAALRALAAFALFSLLASAIYVLNDIVDVEADRKHPVKKLRPIPAGTVPMGVAKGAFVGLLAVVVAGGALLSPWFLLAAAGYLVLNLAYSFELKRVAYVDVLCIALGFELRVLAGAYASDIPPSVYLLVVMFLAAMFLGLGKRLHELGVTTHGETRSVLRAYDPGVLTWLVTGFGVATGITYAIYTLDPDTMARFGTPYLVVSSIFVLFGLLRFVFLVRRRSHAESPTDAMLRDLPFLVNLALWAIAVTVILYAT
jgi:4-hydroxybenzoate polyprenyltransferase